MTDPRDVEAECAALVRYLAGHPPSAYLIECYRRALPLARSPEPSPVDGWLLRAARLGRWPARMADGYARFVRPTGDYRRRLTLALALLENAPDTHAATNDAATGTPLGIGLGVVAAAAASLVAIGLGFVVFGPLHLVARLVPERGGG
jgi:hypothetical protein